MKTKNTNKWNIDNLRWVNTQDGGSFHAGVAFYIPKIDQYKLMLDAPRTILFLKVTGSTDDRIQYSVLAPIMKNKRIIKKIEVGHGYSSKSTSGHIYMKLGAYSNSLTLIPWSKDEK